MSMLLSSFRVKDGGRILSGPVLPVDKSTRRHTCVQKYLNILFWPTGLTENQIHFESWNHIYSRQFVTSRFWRKCFIWFYLCYRACLLSCPVTAAQLRDTLKDTHVCVVFNVYRQTLTVLPSVGETVALSAPVSEAHLFFMKSVFWNVSQRVFSLNAFIIARKSEEAIYPAAEAWNLCFFVQGDDDEEWTSEAEGEAPSAAVSEPDGGCGASGDSSNVTSPPPAQEGDSPHPPAPRLRLKAGLATDPALRITDANAVLTSALPPTATGLEYLAALNPAFHSGETKVKYAKALCHIWVAGGGDCLTFRNLAFYI